MKISNIKVGQIWKHNDNRSGERILKITKIENDKAYFSVSGIKSGRKPTTCVSLLNLAIDKRFEFVCDNEPINQQTETRLPNRDVSRAIVAEIIKSVMDYLEVRSTSPKA